MLIKEVMMPMGKFPVIEQKVILKEALEEMNKYRLGIACIIDKDLKLLGIFTDGDIRRKLLTVQKPFSAFFIDDALDHAVHSPVTAEINDTLEKVIDIMKTKQIWDLPVVDKGGKLVGLLHLHPVVEALMSRGK